MSRSQRRKAYYRSCLKQLGGWIGCVTIAVSFCRSSAVSPRSSAGQSPRIATVEDSAAPAAADAPMQERPSSRSPSKQPVLGRGAAAAAAAAAADASLREGSASPRLTDDEMESAAVGRMDGAGTEQLLDIWQRPGAGRQYFPRLYRGNLGVSLVPWP
jgi:hypothetical protein